VPSYHPIALVSSPGVVVAYCGCPVGYVLCDTDYRIKNLPFTYTGCKRRAQRIGSKVVEGNACIEAKAFVLVFFFVFDLFFRSYTKNTKNNDTSQFVDFEFSTDRLTTEPTSSTQQTSFRPPPFARIDAPSSVSSRLLAAFLKRRGERADVRGAASSFPFPPPLVRGCESLGLID